MDIIIAFVIVKKPSNPHQHVNVLMNCGISTPRNTTQKKTSELLINEPSWNNVKTTMAANEDKVKISTV